MREVPKDSCAKLVASHSQRLEAATVASKTYSAKSGNSYVHVIFGGFSFNKFATSDMFHFVFNGHFA